MSNNDERTPDSLTGGASPQRIQEGARPSQRPLRPSKPPTGPSGGSDAVAANDED